MDGWIDRKYLYSAGLCPLTGLLPKKVFKIMLSIWHRTHANLPALLYDEMTNSLVSANHLVLYSEHTPMSIKERRQYKELTQN